jgi:protein-disulfide isomerase
MRTIILCFVIALISSITAAQKPPERCAETMPTKTVAIDELKKIDRDLDAASEQGDATVFARLLAEDMINVSPEGTVSKKTDVVQSVRPPKKGTTLTITATDIQAFVSCDTGVITSNKTAKWQSSSGSNVDQYRETNTYSRKNSQWFLIASQTSHAPPPYSAKDVSLNLTIDETQIGGNRNASVILVEFADYECPYCRQFAGDTMKQIAHDYIDNGRIGFVFHDFPIESSHPHAFSAALAALCAGEQGHLWEMNHKLLAESSVLARDELFRDAEAMKLDMVKFGGCFADEKTATRLRQSMREASELGIDGTPMFILGIRKPGSNTVKGLRMIEGGYPYEVFRATLDMLIATQN